MFLVFFFLPLATCMWINPGAHSYMVLAFTNGFLQELTLFSWSCGVPSALPVIQAMNMLYGYLLYRTLRF
jgi:hypothetical protein